MGVGSGVFITVLCTILPSTRPEFDFASIVILATLRSPFLPQAYAGLPPLWLLTLLGARGMISARSLVGVLAGWIAFNLYWPTDWGMDPRLLVLITTVPQALTIALAVFVLVERARAPGPSPARRYELAASPT